MDAGARPPRRVNEWGFTLVEVVVGMVLFAILLVAGLGLLIQASRVTGANARRTTAANLLTGQLEAARAARADQLTNGTQDVPVGGTTYKVVQVTSDAPQSQATT